MMDKTFIIFVSLLSFGGVQTTQLGQCSDVTLTSDFDLQSFAGVWHEIEAYPKEQQTGSCITHEFTPSTTRNTLNVVSKQMVNYGTTSTFGNVTVESTDGSARLQLRKNAINFPYWILDTDYTDYALVYSCININANFRSIRSWKLSRTRTLSTAALAAIERAMAAVQVLDNEHFDAIDQSEESCSISLNMLARNSVIFPGQCTTVSPVTNFQAASFAGTWHERSRYDSDRQSGDCAAQEFTITGPNSFTLTKTSVYNERLTTVSGPATLAADGTGVLTATLSDGAGVSYSTTLHILDTDYDEFAIIYSCENLDGTTERQIYAWIISRGPVALFSQAALDRISQVVENNIDLHKNFFRVVGQRVDSCFYYPVFDETPETIIIPGFCPYFTRVVPLSQDDFLGNWYTIASYPARGQNGTCSRSAYTPGPAFIPVAIRNTMVVDRELQTQDVEATFFSNVGYIRMSYTVDGVRRHLDNYVLSTDYTSYALMYSCENQEDETFKAYSWKLSRTPTLTPEASIAIDNVISNTQGLLEEYYVPNSQSAEDCFYVPEYEPGQSVMFRGACGAVTGMQGFDASQYVGWWNEIERYPGDDVPGQCTSAQFVQLGNAFYVMESSIAGGVSNETTSSAVISVNGHITIQRSTGPVVWYILDTDYNSYSLLYACKDVTTDWGVYRRVWSAKHSKSRSLTQAAQNAMNPIISANDLLYETLYETVDQSAAACLHSREEVVLPGQCDAGIPVQSGFDISRFAGTWYQLERYPYAQVSNDATCVGARYSVSGASVDVLNWELLDNTLNTIRGSATVDSATATLRITLAQDTRDLRILATDYEDYALAYTCVNVNANQRSVGAFKLSRSRTLSSGGHTAIDAYMANRDELYQHYFISVEQHDECPNSALLLQSSIIVVLVTFVLKIVM